MRGTLSCLTLLCLGCAGEPSAGKHDEIDAGTGDNAQDARAAENLDPARLEVEW